MTVEPVPLGGAPLRVEAYADFLAKEYLGDFIRSGGGAVRLVVVGSDEVGRRWHARLAEVARPRVTCWPRSTPPRRGCT